MANVEKFQQEMLEAHNQRRALHQAPPVKLSADLNTIAQSWATDLAKQGKFEHSVADRRKGAGENIAAHTKLLSGDEVTQMWYSEIENYNYSNPVFAMNTSHFTQVVWKNCAEIGVGVSPQPGTKGMYVYVANYKPAGNMKGDFDKNVLPKTK